MCDLYPQLLLFNYTKYTIMENNQNQNQLEPSQLTAKEKSQLFTTQASLAHIHKLSSVILLVFAGGMSYFGKPLHSEVYILLGTYISSGNHILDYYFGNRTSKDNKESNK